MGSRRGAGFAAVDHDHRPVLALDLQGCREASSRTAHDRNIAASSDRRVLLFAHDSNLMMLIRILHVILQ